MNRPEQQIPGGESPYLEPLIYSEHLFRQVDAVLTQTSARYLGEQALLPPPNQTVITADTWLTMRYALCDTFLLGDEQLIQRAKQYDEGPYQFTDYPTPGDILADEVGRNERGSGLGLFDEYLKSYVYHLHRFENGAQAKWQAMLELRGEVARRTFRLAYLGLLDAGEYSRHHANRELANASGELGNAARALYRRLTTADANALAAVQ